MIETVKLESGWLAKETRKASEQFAERLKRDFGVLDAVRTEPSNSTSQSASKTDNDESGQR